MLASRYALGFLMFLLFLLKTKISQAETNEFIGGIQVTGAPVAVFQR